MNVLALLKLLITSDDVFFNRNYSKGLVGKVAGETAGELHGQ